MRKHERMLHDVRGPIMFIKLNLKLIERYRKIQHSSISKFTSYNIITLFHSIVIYIGIVFDNSKKSSSLQKFYQEITNKKLTITNYKKWIELYNSTSKSAKTIINLRNQFHAHKDSGFDINTFWEQNPEVYDMIPSITENCTLLFDMLSLNILGFELDTNSTINEILEQFDIFYKE